MGFEIRVSGPLRYNLCGRAADFGKLVSVSYYVSILYHRLGWVREISPVFRNFEKVKESYFDQIHYGIYLENA